MAWTVLMRENWKKKKFIKHALPMVGEACIPSQNHNLGRDMILQNPNIDFPLTRSLTVELRRKPEASVR